MLSTISETIFLSKSLSFTYSQSQKEVTEKIKHLLTTNSFCSGMDLNGTFTSSNKFRIERVNIAITYGFSKYAMEGHITSMTNGSSKIDLKIKPNFSVILIFFCLIGISVSFLFFSLQNPFNWFSFIRDLFIISISSFILFKYVNNSKYFLIDSYRRYIDSMLKTKNEELISIK